MAYGSTDGPIVWVADTGSKKIVFCWDIDVPPATDPHCGRTNQDVIRQHLSGSRPDVLFITASTWRAIGDRSCLI